MTTTVKSAREALEAAKAAYLAADIEHPTAVIFAKASLTVARVNYLSECASLIERLMCEDEPLTMYYKFKEATE